MTDLNALIDPTKMSVSKIVRGFLKGDFYVDDSFQRRLVWGEKQKVRLIETILIGYPIPEIYIHQMPTDTESGDQQFSIVDGQQRINCIAQFVSDEWPIKSTHLDDANKLSTFSNKKWSELDSEYKSKIYDYTFSCRIIPPLIQTSDVRKVFKRLNETDRSLNPQEIRHAEFDGKFIKLSESLADLDFWRRWSIFSERNVRRMADVEFTTSLLSFEKNGIISDSQTSVNTLYDLYNDSYPSEKLDRITVIRKLDRISRFFEMSKIVLNFFAKPVHLFTLYTIIYKIDDLGYEFESLIKVMEKFILWNETHKTSSLIANYKKGSEQRTRSKVSRDLRRDSLLTFISHHISLV